MQQIYSNKVVNHQINTSNTALKAYGPIASLPEINRDFPMTQGLKQF